MFPTAGGRLVPSNQQRRETERVRLQQHLEQRRERDAARRRVTLISSIVGTLVVIAVVIVLVVVVSGGSDSTRGSGSTTGTVSFKGVRVAHATDLQHAPQVSSSGQGTPAALATHDLVVGKGAAATPTSSVTVQYTGVLYKDGQVFDSSWSRGQPATFSLNQVVPGFTQGIGGNGTTAPMHVGGRRIMILPPSMGYGSQPQQSIPANSTLVFVVDLLKVNS